MAMMCSTMALGGHTLDGSQRVGVACRTCTTWQFKLHYLNVYYNGVNLNLLCNGSARNTVATGRDNNGQNHYTCAFKTQVICIVHCLYNIFDHI